MCAPIQPGLLAPCREHVDPCAQIGKDRTGLIAALILAACGATDDEIVSDYAR